MLKVDYYLLHNKNSPEASINVAHSVKIMKLSYICRKTLAFIINLHQITLNQICCYMSFFLRAELDRVAFAHGTVPNENYMMH